MPLKDRGLKREYDRNRYASKKTSLLKDQKRRRNTPEAKKKRKQAYQDNKDKHREYHLVKTYGLTLEAFNSLLESQGGGYCICGSLTPGGRGYWHVDHDHVTGKVRSILCHNCNLMLGYSGDSPERLIAGANYLVKHNKGV